MINVYQLMQILQELILQLMIIKTYLKVPLLIKKAEKAECVSRFRAGSAINGFNLSDGRSKRRYFLYWF